MHTIGGKDTGFNTAIERKEELKTLEHALASTTAVTIIILYITLLPLQDEQRFGEKDIPPTSPILWQLR